MKGKLNLAMRVVRDVVYGLPFIPRLRSRSLLERSTIEGDSPVDVLRTEVVVSRVLFLGHGAGTWGASTSNPKYVLTPIAKSTVRER